MVELPQARAPQGLRLYAIGDVHGCADLLRAVHDRIDADLAHRPAGDHRIIHVGDYIDRGPDSRGAVEAALARLDAGRCECLRGNHEQFLIDVLDEAPRALELWLNNGGVETLASYGVELPPIIGASAYPGAALAQRLRQALPDPHLRFFRALPHLVRFGDYAFVHAGIQPGKPLDRQREHDMIWIREPFLTDAHEHEAVIVHGHTPTRHVEIRSNRIGIDTGAVFGGDLACLVLEDDRRALLTDRGLTPLSIPDRNDRG